MPRRIRLPYPPLKGWDTRDTGVYPGVSHDRGYTLAPGQRVPPGVSHDRVSRILGYALGAILGDTSNAPYATVVTPWKVPNE